MPDITSRLSTAKGNVLSPGIGSAIRSRSFAANHLVMAAVMCSMGCATAISSRESHSCTQSPQVTIRERYNLAGRVSAVSLEGLVFGSPIPAGSTGLCYYRTTLVVEALYRGDTRDLESVHWVLVSLVPPGTSDPDFVLTLDVRPRGRLLPGRCVTGGGGGAGEAVAWAPRGRWRRC